MKDTSAVTTTALASLLLLASATITATARADVPKMEKCYGIVKAGKNDCQTNSNACAGTAKKDGQKDAWLYLPKGSCEKIVGGSLAKK